MNWGAKVIIGMAVVMISIVATGIYMVSQDTDTLEENDYYEKGLSYDKDYNKKENVLLNDTRVAISVINDSLTLRFRDANNNGIIAFRRPSDRMMDKRVHFATKESYYKIPVENLKKGAWRIRLDWTNNDTSYLQEQNLYIN